MLGGLLLYGVALWVLRPLTPFEQDEVLFLRGLEKYDVAKHAPHPPGYPLYIGIGKALRALVGDPVTALQLVSVAAAMAALLFAWLLARRAGATRGEFFTPDLQALVTKSMTGVEKEVGEAWDGLDVPGKKAIIDGGGEAIKLSAAEDAKFRKIGAEVDEAKVKELEGKGMPARAVYTTLKSLAEKHAKTSKNFWN